MVQRTQTHPISDGILQALRGVGGVFTEASEAVSRAVTQAVHEARLMGAPVAASIDDVTRSAMEALADAGEDTAVAVKGISVGVVLGTRERGEAAFHRISETARTIIQETLRNGGDLVEASRGLVKGALHTARHLGLEAAEAAALAAGAAIEEAGEWSAEAARTVRHALEETPIST